MYLTGLVAIPGLSYRGFLFVAIVMLIFSFRVFYIHDVYLTSDTSVQEELICRWIIKGGPRDTNDCLKEIRVFC